MNSIAVFTMVYNETVMLPLWERHYSKQVGNDHVYIFDHGSTASYDVQTKNYAKLGRDELCEIERLKFVSDTQKRLLRSYKHVLFVDCDEFVIARPSYYRDLRDFVAGNSDEVYRCTGVDVIPTPDEVTPIDWSQPILRQRQHAALRFWSCKPALAARPLDWTPGFHDCQIKRDIDPDLWLFHLKHADIQHLMNRLALTRSLAWSQASIANRLGASHRIPDSTMLGFIQHMQKTFNKDNPGTITPIADIDTVKECPLQQIPVEFLDVI